MAKRKATKKVEQLWRFEGKGPLWRGQYEQNERDKRFFILLRVQKNGKVITKVHESHQAAKKAGWKLVK